MTDVPPGDDWWKASDGKYYPPETHPDYVPPAPEIPAPVPPPVDAGPPAAMPTAPPSEPPTAAPIAPAAAMAAPAPSDGTNAEAKSGLLKFWWIPVLLGVIGLGIVGILALGGDDDPSGEVATADATPTPAVDNDDADDPVEPTAEPVEEPTAAPVEEPTTEPADDPTPEPAEEPTAEPEEEPTPEPEPEALDPVDLTPIRLASISDPAGLGEYFRSEEWEFTVHEVVDGDAAGLVDEFSDEIDDDETNLAIIYEIIYLGGDYTAYNPTRLQVIGQTETYDAFFGCYLDPDALAAIDVEPFGSSELVPGQSMRLAECAVVPDDELDDLVIEFEYSFSDNPAYFADGGTALPPLNPSGIVSGPPDVETVALGTEIEWEEWSAAVTSVTDANEDGLISRFAEEPADGWVYLAVRYTVTNTGTESEFDPIVLDAIGNIVYGSFTGCFLDSDAMEDAGLIDPFDEVDAGASKDSAVCIAMPADVVDEVVIRMQNFSAFDEPSFYSIN